MGRDQYPFSNENIYFGTDIQLFLGTPEGNMNDEKQVVVVVIELGKASISVWVGWMMSVQATRSVLIIMVDIAKKI